MLFDAGLVPRPRYVADHGGTKPELDAAGEARWRGMLERAEICFDFDCGSRSSCAPTVRSCAGCRRPAPVSAATCSGSGLRPILIWSSRRRRAPTPCRSPEFAVTGALYLVKGVPELLERQRRHHWERYTTSSLAGRTVTVVGLGEIGRHTARAFAALGTRVIGLGRPGGSRPELPGCTVRDTDALDDVLPSTDVLVLATPLTPQTTRLLTGAASRCCRRARWS